MSQNQKRKYSIQFEQESMMDSDGVSWLRGPILGKGAFGSVFLATSRNPKSRFFPPTMAVKSAEFSASASLQKEKEILNNLLGCPHIVQCFGDETTFGTNGEMVYNVLLEYASGGTLADSIKKSNGVGLPEHEVRLYTRCILEGLCHVHDCDYVHCDLKPDNVLLVPNKTGAGFVAKIGDFGLAKRGRQSKKHKFLSDYLRGTTMYLAPETVIDHVQELPSDVWSLGCVVLEMLTGQKPWNSLNQKLNSKQVLNLISDDKSLPEIPSGVSREARDFLKGCLVRKPGMRLTIEMLLYHPFVQGLDDQEFEVAEDGTSEESSSSYAADSEFSSDCCYSSFRSEEEADYTVEDDDGLFQASKSPKMHRPSVIAIPADA
ncbi:hypothetical protein LWI28_027566 [Acer negundo]|uniref:Protein kinase domain-containing protein n=1 Tax=Acer negundo TaxID=4023 RepID=A0AAD5JED1_ACENE|nr:hypothetical protein LWI28_027566 [Acer negundo]